MSFAVRMFTLNSRWARTTSMRKGLVTAVTTRLSTLDSSLNKPKPLLSNHYSRFSQRKIYVRATLSNWFSRSTTANMFFAS